MRIFLATVPFLVTACQVDNAINDEDYFEYCTLVSSQPVATSDPGVVGFSADDLVGALNQEVLLLELQPRQDSDSQVPVSLNLTVAASLVGDVLQQERVVGVANDRCIDGDVMFAEAEISFASAEFNTVGITPPVPGVVPTSNPKLTWRSSSPSEWWVDGGWAGEASIDLALELFPNCATPELATFTLGMQNRVTTPWQQPVFSLDGACDGSIGIWEAP